MSLIIQNIVGLIFLCSYCIVLYGFIKKINNFIHSTSYTYVSFPICILYLLLYIFAKLPISFSTNVYIYSSIMCLLGLWYYYQNPIKINWKILLFVFIIYQYFLGAYMEIPSDVVGVHFYRISQIIYSNSSLTNNSNFYNYANNSSLFFYFFSASLIQLTSFLNSMYLQIDITYTILLTIFMYSFYNFINYFVKSNYYTALSILLSGTIFGISCYSYFKYYTFAPTFIAFIFFFESIILFYESKNKVNKIPYVIGIILLCIQSFIFHKQELLFILLFIYFLLIPKAKILFIMGIPAILLISFMMIKPNFSNFYSTIHYYNIGEIKNIKIVVAKILPFIYNNHFTQVFNITSIGIIFLSIFPLVCRKMKIFEDDNQKQIFYFSFFPIFILLYPLTCTLLTIGLNEFVSYRILYSSFSYLSFGIILKNFYGKMYLYGKYIILLVVLGISFNVKRSNHFLMLGQNADEKSRWQPMYNFLRNQRILLPFESTVYAITDWITAYNLPLMANIYSPVDPPDQSFRASLNGTLGILQLTNSEEITQLLQTMNYQFIIINLSENKLLSKLDGHWSKNIRDTSPFYNSEFLSAIDILTKNKFLVKIYEENHISIFKKI